ncbi:MAG: NAD(P)-dependent oxidoreductase [Desulfobacterales bacterium]
MRVGKHYLVTGSSGFIGRHLSKRLAAEGGNVIGVDLSHESYGRSDCDGRFRKVAADYRDLEEDMLAGVDVIFHLAGAHLQTSISESEYWDINVHGLRPLLEAAKRNGVNRFVHVSSVGVYGNLKEWPADENSPCTPSNIYGRTKLAGEIEVKHFCEKTHFPIVIVRPAWVYGPGCPRTLKLYRTLRKKRFVMIGDCRNPRHPIYIEDMVDALLLAGLSNTVCGETVVVGGDRALTTAEVLDCFCHTLDLPKPRLKLPMKAGELMATGIESLFALSGKNPPVSRRSLEFFTTCNAFDISKARKMLGFNPSFSFENGVKTMRPWLEDNL